MRDPTRERTCGGAPGDRPAGRSVSLSVLPDKRHVRKSKNSRRRAAVLIALHVVIAAHVVQWLVGGRTLSPIEPSESMYTLERGAVNAGFVFFALAVLGTLVFGRFVCGWGCHIVALQDLCGWIMRRVGVHPKPFRSRLLVLAPLALAVYMFVWPTLKREVIEPAFIRSGGAVPAWMGRSAPVTGLTGEFIVEDFWATFPPWYVAIPFLAVCGFAAVYFLGAKGFCTYGCPYGGVFGPADLVAPGRIVVSDACEGCGHCTAVCTSNVRVHEEVRDFGMVVDPGCMKCMDCVSVCPNQALSYRLVAPPMFNERVRERRRAPRSRHKHDVPLWGEVILLGLGFVLFAGFRGMFNQVPMLMAIGLAGIGAFAAWKLACMVGVPNVRLQSLQLRYRGRWTRAGAAFAALGVVLVGAGLWGAAVRYNLWRARVLDAGVVVAHDAVFDPSYAPGEADRARALASVARFRRADAPGRGGFGWPLSDGALIRKAWMHLVAGERAEAEADIRRAMTGSAPSEELLRDLAAIMSLRRAGLAEFELLYREILGRHRHHAGAHLRLAQIELSTGRATGVEHALAAARHAGHDAQILVAAGALLAQVGRLDEAIGALARAADLRPGSGPIRADLAAVYMLAGKPEEALARLRQAAAIEPANAEYHARLAELLGAMGRSEEGAAEARRAEQLRGNPG